MCEECKSSEDRRQYGEIIKGNLDLTEDYQDEHRRLLDERELRAQFPDYFKE